MARSVLFHMHDSSRREGYWTLEQHDDGTLHVLYEDEMAPRSERRMPINEFLAGNSGGSRSALMTLLDGLFEKVRT